MYTYYFRCAEENIEKLIDLLTVCNVLKREPLFDVDNNPIGEEVTTVQPSDSWDAIGKVRKPTGSTVTIEGIEQPVTDYVRDSLSRPLFHFNLMTNLNLKQIIIDSTGLNRRENENFPSPVLNNADEVVADFTDYTLWQGAPLNDNVDALDNYPDNPVRVFSGIQLNYDYQDGSPVRPPMNEGAR